MANFYRLEPEVPGELGANSDVDRSVHPPIVTSVEYAFHNWLGDDLITAFPVFLVSDHLADKLRETDLGGYEIAEAAITLAEEGKDWIGDADTLPHFNWLRVSGTAGVDDLGLTDKAALVVSTAALTTLRAGKLEHCDVEDHPPDA